MGEVFGQRWMRVDTLSATVNNRSPEDALNVHMTYSADLGGTAVYFDRVPAAGRKATDWAVQGGKLEVPEDQAALALQAEPYVTLRFDMFNSTWVRRPDGTLTRDGIEVPTNQ